MAHLTPSGGQSFPTSPQPQFGAPPARSGGGKGLIIGLGAAAALLAVIGVILFIRQSQPDDTSVAAPTPPAVPTAVATIPTAPEKPSSPEPVAEPDAGKALVAAATPRKVAPTTPPAPAPPPAPTLTGDAACSEARRLADNGDTAGALRIFAGCSGSLSAQARNAITRSAPSAVQRRIFNGDCAGARALVSSLAAIGAVGGADAVLDKAPQCKK